MKPEASDALVFTSGDSISSSLIDAGEVILRSYDKSAQNYVNRIVDVYNKFGLDDYGIVHTTHVPENCMLSHRKHIISYPNEWTPSMFKDAVLYYLDLLLSLERFGLTLKDALPENILFDGVNPVFVDFFSMVFSGELKNEEWLMEGATSGQTPNFRVFEIMFVPYMLRPLLCYLRNDIEKGQRLLDEEFCNCAPKNLGYMDKLRDFPVEKYLKSKIRAFLKSSHWVSMRQEKYLKYLVSDKSIPWIERLLKIRCVIETCNVVPPESGYVSYYAEKKEDFGINDMDSWKEKQKSVYQVLKRCIPSTVLDIGANTGWFSRLACKNGAKVIATDMDVSSIDALYREACMCKLQITPLCMTFDDFTKERYSFDDKGQQNQHPFHIAGTKRLACDVVFCLGLLHHLTLGMGKSFNEVFEILAKLTKRTLILEFVGMEDHLIKNEPDFFRNIGCWNNENYNREEAIKVGMTYFDRVEILPSHPETRVLIIFDKGDRK